MNFSQAAQSEIESVECHYIDSKLSHSAPSLDLAGRYKIGDVRRYTLGTLSMRTRRTPRVSRLNWQLLTIWSPCGLTSAANVFLFSRTARQPATKPKRGDSMIMITGAHQGAAAVRPRGDWSGSSTAGRPRTQLIL
jgi:hypothetical protein